MADEANSEYYYNGQVNDDGIAHGIGDRRYANGDVYSGSFVNGKMCGEGKVKYADGVEYEGVWEDDQKHGKGTYTLPSGGVYVGEWRNGKMCGAGRMKYADGDEYEGKWEGGRMHGKGTYRWPDGDVYVGEWRNGERHGAGKMIFASGSEYEGDWRNDEGHGKGTIKSTDGSIYTGEWMHGMENGEFTFESANGEVFKQRYVQGDLKSEKLCISDVAPIHGLLSSPSSRADDIVDIIVLNEHDKECPVCSEKFLPDVDAKKPVIGSCLCGYTVCHKCMLDWAHSNMDGGVVPTRVNCMGCRAEGALCPAVPLYDRRLINFLNRSVPVLRKTDLGYVSS
jgi:hypothetical protein